MNDDQWEELRDDMIGLWGGGSMVFIERRLAVWAKRLKTERHAVVEAAMRQLESQEGRGWPALSTMYTAIDDVKRRWGIGGVSAPRRETDTPLTHAEWMDRAALLTRAAGDRVRSGRGTERDTWHRYLLDLAAAYEDNAARVLRGEPIVWPPPLASAAMAPGLSRVLRDTSREDRDEVWRRRAHLPPAAEEWVDDAREP